MCKVSKTREDIANFNEISLSAVICNCSCRRCVNMNPFAVASNLHTFFYVCYYFIDVSLSGTMRYGNSTFSSLSIFFVNAREQKHMMSMIRCLLILIES